MLSVGLSICGEKMGPFQFLDDAAVGLGEGGLVEATSGAKTWIDFSSIDKSTILGINDVLAGKGWTVVDAGAGGVEEVAAAGQLQLWVSGDKAVFDHHDTVKQ